jgi:hypothetical protein
MRQPIVYSAEAIKNWDCAKYENHRWSPSRPEGHNLSKWWKRWTTAWGVLTGKYDALTWQ